METINLFEPISGLATLKSIYNIPDRVLGRIINRCIKMDGIYYEVSEDCVSAFLEETGIHPDTFIVTDNYIHCKHITTAFDDGESIKKRGLLPLNILIEGDSSIYTFLKENGVEVSPSRGILQVDKKKYYIPASSRECTFDEWDKYRFLSPRLYHDHGEIEAFISGEEQEMINYSTVSHCPEIISTINTTIKNITNTNLQLDKKWVELKPKTYVIDFDVKISNLSYNSRQNSKKDFPDLFREYSAFFEEDHFDDVEQVWQNEWIISGCLENSCAGNIMRLSTVGIKSDVVIPGDKLTITCIS